ncbi:MAG: LEA type 2 family protein [Bacteroidales bacterium]|jgi:LEA14-like dessication related protein|nr:LEA type 2 family protein [Bacteroidales bacterium]
MKRRLILFLAVLPLYTGGCSLEGGVEAFDEAGLWSIKSVTYNGFDNMVLHLEITATVSNPNRMPVKIREVNMDLRFDGQKIGAVAATEPLRIRGGVTADYQWRLSVRIDRFENNPNALFRILMNTPEKLSLSGTFTASSLLRNKTVVTDQWTFPSN